MRIEPTERIRLAAESLTNNSREDILIEYARALNQAGEYKKAIDLLLSRNFTPCEGGEHAVAEQFMFAQHALGRKAFAREDFSAALEYFRAAQILPDSLGAGIWNNVLLVPHSFFEAECLAKLGRQDEASSIYLDITSILIDYFTNMHLPELRCWQAVSWDRLGYSGRSFMMLKEHCSIFEEIRVRRYVGNFKTTPFFISYMEAAETLRDAFCDWNCALANSFLGNDAIAREYALKSLDGEPFNLYALLLAS